MDINSTRICRTCQSVHELMDIFDTENEVLVFMIQQLANIFINENDLLPKQICFSCVNSLKLASEFVVRCQKTDKILRARFGKAKIAVDTPHISPGDSVNVSVKIEPFEIITIKPELNLNSMLAKEDYPEEIELVEKGICGGIQPKFIDDEGIEFDEYDIIEVDEEFLDETTDTADVNCINEYSEEVKSPGTILTLKADIVQPVATSSKRSKRVSSAHKVKRRRAPQIKKDKTYTCSMCSATFKDFSEYTAHRRTHGPYRYECKICGRQFAKSNGFKSHMEVHGSKLDCPQCGNQYSNRANLLRHIKQTHDNIRPYSCEVCGAQFARMSIMKIHATCHSEERNFACDTCDKKFKTSSALSIHKRKHRPDYKARRHEKLYICEYCGKQCIALPHYLAHKQIHSDVKKFECEVCHKRFHFKLGLTSHMHCHTGERPYTCDICGKAFRQGAHLRTHKRCIHQPGAKRYTCKYCEKSFTSSGTLKIHERLHTGDRPYKCDDCSSRFIDTNSLKRHRRKVHYEPMDSSNAGRENGVTTVVLDENNSITFYESDIDKLNVEGDQDVVLVP